MERFFVSRPIFAICIALAIVLLGAISIFDLSIEQYPDITPPVVEVTASYSGADAETVNDAVATPVVQSVMGVSDMLYMQSTSANDGSMVLQVVFDVGTDPDLDAIFTQNNVATSTALWMRAARSALSKCDELTRTCGAADRIVCRQRCFL